MRSPAAVVSSLWLALPAGAVPALDPPKPVEALEVGEGNGAELEATRGLRIASVRIERLRFTRAASLDAFIDTRAGEAFDPDRLRADLVRLGNLELFEQPHARVRVRERQVEVVFVLEDKWTLLPYFKFLRGGGSGQIMLGVYDVNIGGRIWELGGEYRHFNGHPAGDFYLRVPRPFGTTLTLGGEVLVETTGRTAYEGDRVPVYEYVVDRRHVETSAELAILDWLRVGAAFSFERDGFSFATSSPATDLLPPDGDTASVGARLTLGDVRFHDDYRQSGTDLKLRADLANRYTGSDFDLRVTQAAWRGFLRLGRRHNLGARVQASHATGDVQFQHELVLGALNTSRGFWDDQFRGRDTLAANLEYRLNLGKSAAPIVGRFLPILRGRPFQFQMVAFSDLGVYDGSPQYARDHAGELLAALGAGLRVIVRPLFRTILRLDVAHTVSPFSATDVVIGTRQFF